MRLICPNCGAQYEVDDSLVPEAGRDVQCSNCGHGWFQRPAHLDAGLADELGHRAPTRQRRNRRRRRPAWRHRGRGRRGRGRLIRPPTCPAIGGPRRAGGRLEVRSILVEEARRETQARRGDTAHRDPGRSRPRRGGSERGRGARADGAAARPGRRRPRRQHRRGGRRGHRGRLAPRSAARHRGNQLQPALGRRARATRSRPPKSSTPGAARASGTGFIIVVVLAAMLAVAGLCLRRPDRRDGAGRPADAGRLCPLGRRRPGLARRHRAGLGRADHRHGRRGQADGNGG